MTDIVQRLRLVDPNQVLLAPPPLDTAYLQVGLICHEAAAEIKRLRAEVLAEREACAKVCESLIGPEYATGKVDHNERAWTELCGSKIRARGES